MLLAFGADVNLVNSRHHTPLDLATFMWIMHERQTKIHGGTNNLETVQEHKRHSKFKSFPDITSSPLLSKKTVSRTSSNSSWVYVDEDSESSASSGGEGVVEKPIETSNKSSEDSRDFTSSVMPIKCSDLSEEVLDDTINTTLLSPAHMLLREIGDILELLYTVHAQSGKLVICRFNKVPLLLSFSDSVEFKNRIDDQLTNSNDIERSVKIKDFIEGKTVFSLYEELEFNINRRFESQFLDPDEAIALAFQQREMVQYKRTEKLGINFMVSGGSRLLFLDGGGIKGLAQIEIMRQIEEATGRKIIELFDWIVGSSIGGILALGLVYGKLLLGNKNSNSQQYIYYIMHS